MTVIVDASVTMAVLDPANEHHKAVHRALRAQSSIAILDVTRSEVVGKLPHLGYREELMADLHRLGFRVKTMGNELALAALMLREEYSNKWFPIVDAAVVAYAMERSWQVMTVEHRWPPIEEAKIEVIGARPAVGVGP